MTAVPIVYQSARACRPEWMDRCLRSVEAWAACQGFGYTFVGDELFDLLPAEYREKVNDRPPILADLARLILMENHLREHGGTAVWVDADTLCIDDAWRPDLDPVGGFGREAWVQSDERGRWRCFTTPHNGFVTFAAGSPVLPFLRHLTESMISRADPAHIAPQMVGPKLLKALHSLADFTLYPQAGALSPALLKEVTTAPGEAIACWQQAGQEVPAMVNLCASLVADDDAEAAVMALTKNPQLLLRLGE